MKKSEALDLGMRGIITLMSQEQDKKKQNELNKALKMLAAMFILEERKESKQYYLSSWPQNAAESLLGALKLILNFILFKNNIIGVRLPMLRESQCLSGCTGSFSFVLAPGYPYSILKKFFYIIIV